MFLLVIGILSLVLAFPQAPYPWLRDPGWIMGAVALAALVPPGVAIIVSRRVVHLLDRHPDDPGIGQFFFGRAMTVIQALLGALHAALLLLTGWLMLCRQTPIVGGWPVAPGLLAVVPFLISIVLMWVATYPADRAVRQIALEVYLYRGKPLRPVWPLGEYVVFNLRHQVLFVLIPMLLILGARDVITIYQRELNAWWGEPIMAELLLGVCAMCVAIVAPAILRRVWVTQRLPDGPLRDRLLELAGKLHVRCRELLVWESGGMIVNAAVMGVVAPLRYLLITDAMLEQMDDTKIEAVFGHEAGHVKRHHILFFLMFAFISGCWITIVSALAARLTDPTHRQLLNVAAGALLMIKWGVFFGWISRKFERQADVFGVRTLALSGVPCSMPCALHAADSAAPPGGDALCSTAAHVFGDTLNEVAALNGIPPEARSWRHGSIASRSRVVMELARDPLATARFERLVTRIKIGIAVAALLSGLWAGWTLRIWKLLGIDLGV
jgi:STE24 endopeptidase